MRTTTLLAATASISFLLAGCSHEGANGTAQATGGGGRSENASVGRTSAAAEGARSQADARRRTQSAQRADREIFASRDHYEMQGRVAAVRPGEIVVAREGLPAADLRVERRTRIQLEGKEARIGEIHPGDEVRATFNVVASRLVAVEVDAKQVTERAAQGRRGR